jgi:DNA repair protein RadC
MRPIFEGMNHEECWVLYLTSSNRLLERQRVSQGGVQATVVDHRIIVKRALELLSTQIILVHNHPSGAAEPSAADKTLTRKLKDAAALFDIKLLDHIIISSEGNFSFLRDGLM